ncbi:JmjC domain-containing protein [Uniformispora flossi]|uniref:JmjC domain-containing protein n=1 Tax=Uniformispora flossi TaxID=3390723 RepID=UPI003C2C0055
MRHRLIEAIEDAFGWTGPDPLGREFVRGTITDESLLPRILTPTRLLELVMRRSLGNPQVRMFRDGTELHPREYLSPAGTRRGQNISMVNMRYLGALLTQGATLVLDGTDVFDPTLEVMCRAVQWWTDERAQVNLYLTTAEAQGFGLHWDDHEVIVVQLAGEKCWEVRGQSRRDPMFRDVGRNDQPSEDVLWEGVLSAGDVMHIPRGYWHRATRGGCGDDGLSFHMTIGVTRRTGASWMESLAEWCRDDEVFRRNLIRGASSDQAQQAQELIKAAADLAAERAPAGYLNRYMVETVAARQVPYLPMLGPLDAVVCTTPGRPHVQVRHGQVEAAAAGKRISLAAAAEESVRLLLSGHPVQLSDVDSLTQGLAKLLVEEGMCSTLTPELSSGYTSLVTNATPSKQP